MKIHILTRFCCAPLIGTLISAVTIANTPFSLIQARAEVTGHQDLTDDDARHLAEKSIQLNQNGDHEGAVAIGEKLVEYAESRYGIHHPETATLISNLAISYWGQGKYKKAELHHRKALNIRVRSLDSGHEDIASSLQNLAHMYVEQGFFGRAEPLYERALKIRESSSSPDNLDTASNLVHLAHLYEKRGSYKTAESFYRRALRLREKILGDSHEMTASALHLLASLFIRQDLPGKAEPLLIRSLAIREEVFGDSHPALAASLNNLATLYNSQGRYEKAEPLYQRSLAIHEKTLGLNHPDTAIALNNLGLLYRDSGFFDKAEQLLRRSLEIKEKNLDSEHPNMILSLNNLALLYRDNDFFDKAEPLLRRGLHVESRLIQREASYLTRSNRQAFLATLGSAHERVFTSAIQESNAANLALFTRLNRHGLLQEIEKRQAQLASLPGDQQQVANELRALTQQLSSLSITPQQRQTLKSRQQTLEKELYRLLPQLEPRIVEVEQVAAALPADGVLIEFQRYQPYDGKKPKDERWGKPRYLAMVLKPDQSITVVQLGEAAALEKVIASAVATAREQQADATDQFAALSGLLLEPLGQATAGATTWFVSPDGELNRLPFAALSAPGGKGYLAGAVDLRMLTTGRELLDLQKHSPAPKQSALVLADPAYDRNGRGNSSASVSGEQDTNSDARLRSSDLSGQLRWAPLPATAEEGAAIKAITGGELLVQQQATADAAKQAPTPNVLHLATHAFYLPDQPEQASDPGAGAKTLQGESPMLRSGIALAGANQPNANPNDDGYLTALEVAQLSWEGTDLVVISACESGLGDLQVGEGVYGLKRAIAVAGARSSLLSLWKVDDDATRLFMESFYQRLKQGEGKAAALAATQKQFRESPELKAYSHPFYWAAFQLSGDWGPVKGL